MIVFKCLFDQEITHQFVYSLNVIKEKVGIVTQIHARSC